MDADYPVMLWIRQLKGGDPEAARSSGMFITDGWWSWRGSSFRERRGERLMRRMWRSARSKASAEAPVRGSSRKSMTATTFGRS